MRDDFGQRMTEERVAAMRRSLRRRGLSPADVDDVVQEVLIEVYLANPDPEGHEVERAGWLATVTRRTAGRFCARLFRQREIPTLHDNGEGLPEDAPDLEALAVDRSREQFLRRMLAELPPELLRVVVARELDEKGYAEIAEEHGIPLGTVSTHHQRGMKLLRARARRWQLGQARRRLPLTPMVVAPLLGVRRAWAASAKAMRASLGAKMVALAVVIGLALWGGSLATRTPATERPAITAATSARARTDAAEPAARVAVTLAPAPAFVILPPASDGAVAAVPLRVPPRNAARAEHDLMQRARVAHAAQSTLVARRILERHARMFPRGRYAEERQARLAQLRAMARKPSQP